MTPDERLDEAATKHRLHLPRWMRRGRMLALTVALFAAGTPIAHAGLTLAGQITAGDFTQNGSLDLTSTSSSCGSPKGTPPTTAGTFNYDRYGFKNIDVNPHCFTVSVTSSGIVQPVVYSTSYDASNPQTGYIGDPGSCTNLGGAGSTISFSVTVPPGGFYVIVSDCVSGNVGTPTYTLAVNFDTLFDEMFFQPMQTHNTVLGSSGPSTCGTPSPTPGTTNATIAYDAYTILNTTGSAECVTATIRSDTGGGSIAYGYLGSFDPGSPQTSYIGDSGQGNCSTNVSASFSFSVPAGGQYVLDVEECFSGFRPTFAIDIAISPPTAVTLRSADPVRTPRGVLVRWRTASESDTLGFNVYRQRKGDWVRLNHGLIAAAFGGTPRGCRYSWLDRRAPSGRVKYRLQAVGLDGTRSWIGSAVTG